MGSARSGTGTPRPRTSSCIFTPGAIRVPIGSLRRVSQSGRNPRGSSLRRRKNKQEKKCENILMVVTKAEELQQKLFKLSWHNNNFIITLYCKNRYFIQK